MRTRVVIYSMNGPNRRLASAGVLFLRRASVACHSFITMSETQPESSTSSEVVDTTKAHQDKEGKNAKFIRCNYCSSLILRPNIASFVGDLKKTLPKVDGRNEPEEIEKFWCVQDIFHFENMSFSKTVDNMKYLSCCDCDIGPIGYQNLDDKICYVAFERVTHAEE